ncbi:hypothetical protein CFE70_010454 [Pyrenophora teres f. teres 0-1]
MAPQQILDTHIHLWPSTATSSSNHSWMTRGNILAKRHGISDYLAITSPPPQGFIYVETDRRLPSTEPNIPDSASSSEIRKELELWAKEPLDELRFLRRIAEGTPKKAMALEGTSDAWCFDVGIDTHRDGVEPMEAVASLIKRVRAREDREDTEGRRVKFVLSALNEFDNQPTPADIPTLLSALTPYFEHAFHCFPQRVMFGSDWPVCNVGGPAGEEGNWRLWRDVVEAWMERVGMGEGEREGVWWGAGVRAYGLAGLKG